MTARMGRPPKQAESRNKSLNVRLTATELDKINNLAEKMEKSRTDTIMEAINLLEEGIKK